MNEFILSHNHPSPQEGMGRRQRLEKFTRPATPEDLKWVGGESAKIIDVTSKTVLKHRDPNKPWQNTTQFADGTTRFGTYEQKINYPFEYRDVPEKTVGTEKAFFTDSVVEPGTYFHITGDQGENDYSALTKARYCFTQNEGAYKLNIWDQENNPFTIPIEREEIVGLITKLEAEHKIIAGFLTLENIEEANRHARQQRAIWEESGLKAQITQLLENDLTLEEASSRIALMTKNKTSEK
jgi:hypothetical protein